MQSGIAEFIIQSVLLGAGLAMDAFSVSLADGLTEPDMKRGKANIIAGTFGLFQLAMPMLGWVCVHTLLVLFSAVERFIPWTALILLVFIGGKMIIEGIKGEDPADEAAGAASLIVQAVATSIDALSVGFTIASYDLLTAFICSLIIGAVTYAICMAGLALGRRLGTSLAGKAGILGGVILIAIGIKICFF